MEQNFTFFLKFKDYDPPILVQSTEQFKFDGSDFSVEQKNLARDIFFGNEETSLLFYKGTFDHTQEGTYLTMGFEELIAAIDEKGFEVDIDFILKKNGIEFTVGQVLVVTTDLQNFVECKIVQNSKLAEIKRRNETKVDVYSDKNLSGDMITPLVPFNVLFRAKSEVQASVWEQYGVFESKAGIVRFLNPANYLTSPGIDDSITAFYIQMSGLGEDITDASDNFRYILAASNLSDITVNVDLNVDFLYRVTGGDSGSTAYIKLNYAIFEHPFDFSTGSIGTAYSKTITGASNQDFHLPESISFTIPSVPSGLSVAVFWEFFWDTEHLGSGDARTRWVFNSSKMTIQATSTAFNSVVKMNWYRDVIRQVIQSINGMTATMPILEVSGELGKLAVSSGYDVRQYPDKPFYTTWKDITEGGLSVFFGGAQITPETVFIGPYRSFYADREIGSYTMLPDVSFSAPFNDDAQINTIEVKFKNAENDKDELNTVDAIHKSAQYVHPNRMVKKALKIEIDPVYDGCLWESTRKKGISTESATTSLDADEKMYAAELIQLAPGSTDTITARLMQRTNGVTNQLEVLNGSLERSGYFNWTLQGMSVGGSFNITYGTNSGNYTIVAITPTVLTIQGTSSVTQVEDVITATFSLSGILWTNRTNEGLTTTGITNPARFPNQRFNINEIVRKYYGEHLAMISKYHPDGVINVNFSGNGEASITDSGVTYKQNEPIVIADLPEAILTARIYKTKVLAGFEAILQTLEKMNTVYPDGTIGGYITITDSIGRSAKVYPRKLNYEWVSGELYIEGEVKEEFS